MTRLHGAYKTPGGKLLLVDCVVVGGALRDVVIHGDFFLYPEEALLPITAAVEGLPENLPGDAIAARVAAAIPAGTEWLGASAEAVGIALDRARGHEA